MINYLSVLSGMGRDEPRSSAEWTGDTDRPARPPVQETAENALKNVPAERGSGEPRLHKGRLDVSFLFRVLPPSHAATHVRHGGPPKNHVTGCRVAQPGPVSHTGPEGELRQPAPGSVCVGRLCSH